MKRSEKSETVIIEKGHFERHFWRKGKLRKQRTERFKKNNKKVVLGQINDLQLYAYPYEYPDKVFLGVYPLFSLTLEKADLSKLICLYNKARWFLNGEWEKGFVWRNGAKIPRHTIVRAYKAGLDELKKKAEGLKKHNIIRE